MAESIELKATARPRVGKGAARVMRKEGRVPAVIYGDKQPPEPIALAYQDLLKPYNSGRFLQTVYTIDVAGRKARVIPRDVQVDPVMDFMTHVDFQRVGKDGVIRVAIPVEFVNQATSPGLKRGGVLNIVRHEVELYCPVDRIPHHIEVNLDGLEIGASVHISAVKLPADTKPVIQSRDFTIATIAGAVQEVVETPAEGEGAEAAAEGAAAPAADGKAAAPAGDAKAAAGGDAKAASGGKEAAGKDAGKAPAAGAKPAKK
jgi:large subunit ribosomal protein L25